jgi:hypothetical protein
MTRPRLARRCAIYTRKSTTAGLDQAFNSLDAQREACAAYIQRQPGWVVLPKAYEDGGFTGASLERPAFQALLGDIEHGLIDVVVVYKVIDFRDPFWISRKSWIDSTEQAWPSTASLKTSPRQMPWVG